MRIELFEEDGSIAEEAYVDQYVIRLMKDMGVNDLKSLAANTADYLRNNWCSRSDLQRVRDFLKYKGLHLKGDHP